MKTTHNLGAYLHTKRLLNKLTQKQVADFLGYASAQFISNWERGFANPPPRSLKPLCKIYNIPETELLDKLSEMHRKQLEDDFNGI